MKYRALGKTGIQVSEIGHGTWAIGFMWGPRDDAQAKAALKRSLELGVNFIDTAFLYGRGHAEKLIGEVMRETGEKPFVASKIPPNIQGWPPKPGTPPNEAFSADHIIDITEKSLMNLSVDCLDLQQLHVWRPEWLANGEWLGAIEKLKQQGKIRCFGVSLNDHDHDSGLDLVASGLVDSVQVIFNLFEQGPREKLLPACLERGVGVIARVPLDEGGLSGTLKEDTKFPKGDWRVHYFKGDHLNQTVEHARHFDFLIQGPRKSLAQAALQFCLSEAAVSTVIPGMRTVSHVEANVIVPDLAPMSAEDLATAHQRAWPKNFYPSTW
jgi:aryl-alcohol dehydrogenase-like predicted oxidoreductase